MDCSILVDSCSYFRLAQSLHPLLNRPFCEENHSLGVIKKYDITSYKTLELLKIMYDCGHITIKQVRTIAEYWQHLQDTPKSYRKDFKRLFGEPIP